jgi:HK97 family phage prohead protease
MEYKVCPISQLELKANDAGQQSVAGYASTFANWDRVNERPVKGAFASHLAEFKRDGFIYADHKWSFPSAVATVTDAYEDEHGLFISADFHSTPDAQAARTVALERMQRGKSVSFSIGYEVLDDTYVEDSSLPGGTGRLLKDIKLHEVSLVTVPANQLALASGVKGANSATQLLSAKGLPVRLKFTEHSDAVLATVADYADRAKRLHEVRAKEGRVLSGANRERLGNLKTSLSDVLAIIESLLADSEPKGALDLDEQLNTEYMRFLLMEAIANGVEIQ